MKKTWNLFWTEIKKTMNSTSFFLLILAVAAMCFLIPMQLSDKTQTNCLSAFLTMSKEELEMEYFLSVGEIMRQLLAGYFVLLTPMFVSISVLPILCEEKESGAFRLMLFRTGKKQEVIGSFLACVFCGGVLMAAGHLLFAGILGVHSYVLFGSAGIQVIKETGTFVLIQTAEVFTYGMMCAVWTYLVSAFVRNRYLLASIPYILLWFLQRFASKIQWESMAENLGLRLYAQIFGTTYVFLNLTYMLQTAAIYAVVGVLVIWLHIAVMQRRTDCGT